MDARNGQDGVVVEFDLHGIVGIRLVGASARDAAVVARQLGPLHAPLGREPDIVVRFVESLPAASRLRYVGLDDAGFTEDTFVVLRSKRRSSVKVAIPFDDVGGRCEIVCESGVPAVPYLIPIVNLTALARDVLPLHASAFTYRGTGVLVTGWSKGGKTEALLAFMNSGAQYVGDEWTYVMPDGRLLGIPEPLRIWEWHVRELPRYRARISGKDRSRMRAIKAVRRVERALPRGGGASGLAAVRRKVTATLEGQLHVDMPPEKLFGPASRPLAGTLDKVVFGMSHDAPEVKVEPIDPDEIARRMVHSLAHERLGFVSAYLKFRFAFPERRNALLERAGEREGELLARVLRGKEAYAVLHPYPAPIPALFDALDPVLR